MQMNLVEVLKELKGQRVAISEKGEIQWTGEAQNFCTYYYTTRKVVRQRKSEFCPNTTVLELD